MSPSRVTPHEEGRAALYALTAALLLPGSSDDGERLLAALRETDVSHTVGDGNTLADVRSALGELGLVRRDGIAKMEDHVGMLCEAMGLLVAGAPGVAPRPLAQQRAFFEAHLAPWYRTCANDISARTPTSLVASRT